MRPAFCGQLGQSVLHRHIDDFRLAVQLFLAETCLCGNDAHDSHRKNDNKNRRYKQNLCQCKSCFLAILSAVFLYVEKFLFHISTFTHACAAASKKVTLKYVFTLSASVAFLS